MKNRQKIFIIILLIPIIFILSLLGIYKCPVYFLLGIPCPTCGITRAIFFLLFLNFKMAFSYNTLWPLVIIALIVYILCELKIIRIKEKNKLLLIYIVAIIFIVYNVIRLVMGNTPIKINIEDSVIYKIFFK